MTNPNWILRTARMVLTPVGGVDLADLQTIKADPRVFAIMLGGVRTSEQSTAELAEDVITWGSVGFGTWAIRETSAPFPAVVQPARGSRLCGNDEWGPTGTFAGIAGLEARPDGRGVALRFALWPEAQGRGLAREAAGAVLRFGHERAGLRRIVAVARESNVGSRTVLGGIGMTECASFLQQGWPMVMYESIAIQPPPPAGALR